MVSAPSNPTARTPPHGTASILGRIAAIGLTALLLNTALLVAFPTASLWYFANVVLHPLLGLALAVTLGRAAQQKGWLKGRRLGLEGVSLAEPGDRSGHRTRDSGRGRDRGNSAPPRCAYRYGRTRGTAARAASLDQALRRPSVVGRSGRGHCQCAHAVGRAGAGVVARARLAGNVSDEQTLR